MKFQSNLLKEAVDAFSNLPGVGKKSALRFALFLIEQPEDVTTRFVQAIQTFRSNLTHCACCGNLTDVEVCSICMSPKRNQSLICVVESVRDVLAIEATNQYFGVYHVLGGIISPIDGIGPDDLNILPLIERVQKQESTEIIMAIRPTIEGDTTSYYVAKCLEEVPTCRFSVISRGVSFGGELEYTDEITLGRSITSRLPYNPDVLMNP